VQRHARLLILAVKDPRCGPGDLDLGVQQAAQRVLILGVDVDPDNQSVDQDAQLPAGSMRPLVITSAD
jgi:hypothetical protein